MEINFENVFFPGYLEGINLNIEPNLITALIGDHSKDCIGRLLIGLDRQTMGSIMVGDIEVGQDGKTNLRKKVGCLFNNLKNYTLKNTVNEQLDQAFEYYDGLKSDTKKRKIEALKMVGLKENYLLKPFNNLSLTEKKKVIFAATLIFNPEIIILDHFELHFNYEDQQRIKNILKKIKKKYNKTIIVITNNTDFLIDFVDEIIILNEGYIVAMGTKYLLFNKEFKNYINTPEIVEFIWKLREKGLEISNYFEIKELMKAIYREIK